MKIEWPHTEMLILVSDVTCNKHRRSECGCACFSSGVDVEIRHVCSCVVYVQRGSGFFDLLENVGRCWARLCTSREQHG